jgi:hypothetical protein
MDEWARSSLVPDSDLPVRLTIEGSVIADNHLPGPKEPTLEVAASSRRSE